MGASYFVELLKRELRLCANVTILPFEQISTNRKFERSHGIGGKYNDLPMSMKTILEEFSWF
jgi:hypothetical protein